MTIYFRKTLFIIFLLIAISGCGGSSDDNSENTKEAIIPVYAEKVVSEEISPKLDYSGTIEPWNEAALGSEIPGRVKRLYCDIGDKVKAGFLIAEMSGEALIQAQANYEAVNKDWERIKSLYEKGTVTKQVYDQTQAAYDAAKATFDKVSASTQIRAPFSGVITHKYLEEGEIFTLFPGAAGSPAIVRLMQLDTVKVKISVTESEYPQIAINQKATLILDSYSDIEYEGHISRIAPTLNMRTKTADIEITFANQDNKIRPGMFGAVSIYLEPRQLLLIDRDALIRQEGTGIYYVYKIEDNRAVRINIERNNSYGGQVEILSGLHVGNMVITTGKTKVGNGSKVKIVASEVSE